MMISLLKLPGVPASVQVESLHCFSYLCSQSEEGLHVQLVAEFPSILVPMASDDKVINPLFSFLPLPLLLVRNKSFN